MYISYGNYSTYLHSIIPVDISLMGVMVVSGVSIVLYLVISTFATAKICLPYVHICEFNYLRNIKLPSMLRRLTPCSMNIHPNIIFLVNAIPFKAGMII